MHNLVASLFIHLNQRGVFEMFACHIYRTLYYGWIIF
ncbi:hypothetical protein BAZSYMA_ACONTIG150583_0 [Bathymodiolus azoricus thioautotrophic gill symbiont]|uniref:Uncharacterized protein n=1 Tax=Bathymodiolus azoricus thioautotrophic gill symbiont TaxID=235205 RepID=A0A1H6MX31_9GAMM|nr:hypothetical protein BAZSYMA_ACONTIG150583_0 [Bathymodiolus azoricus thioautotrophic gill symbiont]